MVARFKIISDQGASDGPYGTSRKIRFNYELVVQSFGHDTEIFEKVTAHAMFRVLVGLPGAQHLERCFA